MNWYKTIKPSKISLVDARSILKKMELPASIENLEKIVHGRKIK